MLTIERLYHPVGEADLQSLVDLLVDTVELGGSVSFLSPLPRRQAEDWWRRTLSSPAGGAIFLVARDETGIAGTVQLHPAWAPNQPHRAEIAKLMVHRRCRRSGIATRLVQRIEDEARQAGYRLLTLDTRRGDAAEMLYQRLGWTRAGIIPGYALDTDGKALHDTVIFYKHIALREKK